MAKDLVKAKACRRRNLSRTCQKRALQKTRLVELYNRKGPLPKTKGQIRIFVLEVQTILLGILEPDGRKLFPPENQRTIIDHKGTQAWAEYFPSGILATPGHHFRFNMAAIASHPKPWRKFVACALHEGIHCGAVCLRGAPKRNNICRAMAKAYGKKLTPQFDALRKIVENAFPFVKPHLDVYECKGKY
ncbi:hypothetical protein niasHT_029286 [Heterodera trifolii]|uniref:Uncharacterized protein n=1 Tax=Heterodera trifolii TaxID=157864 RepID=A0ABD2KD46_9BILA